jgi:S1-C subfamily serine protease
MKRLITCTFLTCLLTAPAYAGWLGGAVEARPDTGYPGVVVAQMRPIRNPQDLERLVRAAPAGSRVSFALLRAGTPVELTAELTKAPAVTSGKGLPRGTVALAAK